MEWAHCPGVLTFVSAFLMQGSTVWRIGMLAGSSFTIMGAMTDPIMPPTAPEPAMAAVEMILSDSPNQV